MKARFVELTVRVFTSLPLRDIRDVRSVCCFDADFEPHGLYRSTGEIKSSTARVAAPKRGRRK
jgi:hypothetical protein